MKEQENLLYRKIALRLVPFLFISYCFAILDRINIGIAQLQMGVDLGLSTLAFSFGAGIFFLGYMLMEVPSSLMLARVGVRKTFLRILVIWGALAACTALVSTPGQLYLVRFLLGVAEAGFYPGVIFYLTRWFPIERRGRVIAIFTCATGVGGLAAGPLAGGIMSGMDGLLQIHGWQWMFVILGLPTCLLGVLAYFILPETPNEARWLTADEKTMVLTQVSVAPGAGEHSYLGFFKRPLIYAIGFIWFSQLAGVTAIGFFMPTILKSSGLSDPFIIGAFTSIPYVASWIGVLWLSNRSDRKNERRWHYTTALVVGAAGFIFTAMAGKSLGLMMVGLVIATGATYAGTPLLWGIATSHFKGEKSASAIAMINSMGLIGGFLSPMIVGSLSSVTGSTGAGMVAIGTVLIAGAIVNARLPQAQSELSGAEPIQQDPHLA